MKFNVKDRVAIGDNKYILTELPDGRVMLDPAPDSVQEVGTAINKEFLQPIVDATPEYFSLTAESFDSVPVFADGQSASDLLNALEKNTPVMLTVVVSEAIFQDTIYFNLYQKTKIGDGESIWIFSSPFVSRLGSFTLVFTGEEFTEIEYDVPVQDYIVERGEADGWNYIKWATGAAECWCQVTLGALNGSLISAGSIWHISDSQTVNLPSGLFIEAPIVFGEVLQATAKCANVRFIQPDRLAVYFRLFGTSTDFPNTGTVVNILVKGKWK